VCARPCVQLPKLKAKRIDFYFARITPHTDKMIRLFTPMYNGKETDDAHKLKVIDLGKDATAFMPVVTGSIQASVTASQRDAGRLVMSL
jgi:hypothetical protein